MRMSILARLAASSVVMVGSLVGVAGPVHAASSDPIVGEWELAGSGSVSVASAGGGSYVGTVVRDFAPNGSCVHSAGERMWTMSGSNSPSGPFVYSGKHSGYKSTTTCEPLSMDAVWTLEDPGTGTLKLTMRLDSGAPVFTRPGSLAPSAPGAPVVMRAAADSVRLSWPAAASALPVLRYLVEQSRDGGGWAPCGTTSTADPLLTCGGLASGSTYAFRVAAVNAIRQGPFSAASAPIALADQGSPSATPSPGGQQATTWAVTLEFTTATSAKAGTRLPWVVTVQPGAQAAGRAVLIQYRVKKNQWVTMATRTIQADGTATGTVVSKRAGRWAFRAVVKSGAGLQAGSSDWRFAGWS